MSQPITHSSIQSSRQQTLKDFVDAYKPISKINLKALLMNDQFKTRTYKQGEYFGLMQNNMREGQGILIYNDSRVYEGGFHKDRKQGYGHLKYPNGAAYEGEFYEGSRHGKGRFNWINGELYDGEWQDGEKHGSGLWRSPKGDQYIGSWSKGLVQGYGVHVWINGDRYEGQFDACLKHGHGLEKFANGDVYEGEYYKGKPFGNGRYVWSNGSKYKGTFKDGVRDGQGLWTSANGSESYEGDYKVDKKDGQGTYLWQNGNKFEGGFMHDKRHGQGTMYVKGGPTFKGIWLNGHMIPQKVNDNFEETYRNRNCIKMVEAQILKLQLGQVTKNSHFMCLKTPQPILDGQIVYQKLNVNLNDTNREAAIDLKNLQYSLTTTQQTQSRNKQQRQFHSLDANRTYKTVIRGQINRSIDMDDQKKFLSIRYIKTGWKPKRQMTPQKQMTPQRKMTPTDLDSQQYRQAP